MDQDFLDIDALQPHLGRTPLDEWPARRSDLYLTAHDIHKRQASMPLEEFEPVIPRTERSQFNALDSTANGIRKVMKYVYKSSYKVTSSKIFLSIFKGLILQYYRNAQATGVLWRHISYYI